MLRYGSRKSKDEGKKIMFGQTNFIFKYYPGSSSQIFLLQIISEREWYGLPAVLTVISFNICRISLGMLPHLPSTHTLSHTYEAEMLR